MVKHGIPVTPVSYALWYTYVSTSDPPSTVALTDVVFHHYGTVPFSR